jgi:hypothetical protein
MSASFGSTFGLLSMGADSLAKAAAWGEWVSVNVERQRI